MPLDNYESQISQLQEILVLSKALPLKRFTKSKTIKQHLEFCELERTKRFVRGTTRTKPSSAKQMPTNPSPSRQSQTRDRYSDEQSRSGSPTDHLRDLDVRIFDKRNPRQHAADSSVFETKRAHGADPAARQAHRESSEDCHPL